MTVISTMAGAEALRPDVVRALDAASHGEIVFSSAIAGRVLSYFANGRRLDSGPFPALTARKHEVLDLVARGLTMLASGHDLFWLVQSSTFSSGQVVIMRSKGTPLADARAAPY